MERGARYYSFLFRGTEHGRICLLFLCWLLFLLLFSFFFLALHHQPGEVPEVRARTFFQRFFYWDGNWFTDIARYGYRGLSIAREWDVEYISTPFFPLYPLLVRAFSYLLPGNYGAAALAVSWISTLLALLYLYSLSKLYQDRESSYRSCLFLLVFPTAVFLAAGYSEALFLLCAVAAFYHARRSSWLLAGIWGFLACLTRPVGLAVALAIALEAMRQSEWKLSRLRLRQAAVLLSPLGLLSYLLYLQVEFGDMFILFKAERLGWHRGFNPWGFFQALRNVFGANDFFTEQFAQYLYLVLFALLFLVLVVAVFRRFGLPLGAYSAVCYLLPLMSSPASTPLLSLNRLVLIIFPAFMVLGAWGRNRNLERICVFASTLGLAFFTAQFISGYWAG